MEHIARHLQQVAPAHLLQHAADVLADEHHCRFVGFGTLCSWETRQGPDGKEGRYLVRPFPLKMPTERYFNPLDVPGLAYQFASVDPSEGGFLSFAREYGSLGVPVVPFGTPRKESGDTFEQWEHEHAMILVGIEMLRRIEANPNDDETCIGMQALLNGQLRAGTDMRVAWSGQRKRYEVRVYPKSLLGAMWWELARVFTGEVSYARCRVCGKYMERGPRDSGVGVRMVNAVYCSPACRQREHRVRVKVRHMAAGGTMSVHEIAAAVGYDPDTVAAWLSTSS